MAMAGNLWWCQGCRRDFLSMLSIAVCPCCGMKLVWHGASDVTTEEALKLGYRAILWMKRAQIPVDSAGIRAG